MMAKVNALPALCTSGQLRSLRYTSGMVPNPRAGTLRRLRPLFGRTLMPGISDKAFKGEL